ncbi:MAG: peptide deformylase [Candidatus Omnitrophica bacterium]|nr:peptide deformylase [Candidatus Omnitrophota bacterium]
MEKIIQKLKIRIYGDPCLCQKAEAVKEAGIAERMLFEAMIETMYKEKGVGLAAPQVGVNKQIFVVDVGEGPVVVVNPKVIKKSGCAVMEEGCLSVPEIVVKIKRPEKILVKYIDENNQLVEKQYSELMARVFLHEMDHLSGKMIVDYAGWRQKFQIRKQLEELSAESI